HIPRPEQPRIHINLWQFNGPPGTNQEVVLDQFTFVPEDGATGIEDVTVPAAAHLSAAKPNPFNPSTTITYMIEKGGYAEIVVYDVLGRPVRTLVRGLVPAGVHDVVWNGRDDSGGPVASGVYLYRLRASGIVETKKMVLLK
ncbi:MAG: FlgD immunoglobulin-like domain containing protein, partial [bacterium]